MFNARLNFVLKCCTLHVQIFLNLHQSNERRGFVLTVVQAQNEVVITLTHPLEHARI